MLKKTILWTVAFMQNLIGARIASTEGFTIPDANGEPVFVPPNPSTAWPPHRYRPTSKRAKRRYRGAARTINEAMKRGGQNIPVASPGKYLHASRTVR